MSRVDFVFDEQFERGKQYVVYVTQVNSYGLESEFSDPAFITAGSPIIIPPKLSVMDTGFDSNDSIKSLVTWNASTNEDLDFYRLYLYKGVPDWFTQEGFYTDDFPSNSSIFTASKNQTDLTFRNLENDQLYTVGIETVDSFGNVSDSRYVTIIWSEDNSPVKSPEHIIHGEPRGYWCLHIWVNSPADDSAKYIQFFRDGILALNPVDCRSSNTTEILDFLKSEDGLTHRYSYKIIRFDGKKSDMSPLSDPFTANTIDESAFDPSLKNDWKNDFLEDVEDEINDIEQTLDDYDKKIRDLEDDLKKVAKENQDRDDKFQKDIDKLKTDLDNVKNKLDQCCDEVHEKMKDLQSQIKTLEFNLNQKPSKDYVERKLNSLDFALRLFVQSENNKQTRDLQNWVYGKLDSYAKTDYVDQQDRLYASILRNEFKHADETSKTSILNEVKSKIDVLTQSTIPNLIKTANDSLEAKLKKYAQDQDTNLYNRIIQLLNQLETQLNNKIATVQSKITSAINECKQYTDTKIDSLQATINHKFKNYMTQAETIQYIENRLTTKETSIYASVRSSINSAKNEIESGYKRYTDNAIRTLQNSYNSRFNSLEDNVRNISSKINNLDSLILTKINSKLTEFGIDKNTIKNLKDRVTKSENDIASLLNRLNTLEINVKNLSNNMTTNIDSKINSWWQKLVNAGLNLKNVTIENLIITKSLTIRDGAKVNGLELSSSSGNTAIPAPSPDDTFYFYKNEWWVGSNTVKNNTRVGEFIFQFTPAKNKSGSVSASVNFTGVIAFSLVNTTYAHSTGNNPAKNGLTAIFSMNGSSKSYSNIDWVDKNTPITGFEETGSLSIATNIGVVDVKKLRSLGVNHDYDQVYVGSINFTWTGNLAANTTNRLTLTIGFKTASGTYIHVNQVYNTLDTIKVTYS